MFCFLPNSWLVPLEELINRINERYSDFFRRMGCAGEVLLKRDPVSATLLVSNFLPVSNFLLCE